MATATSQQTDFLVQRCCSSRDGGEHTTFSRLQPHAGGKLCDFPFSHLMYAQKGRALYKLKTRTDVGSSMVAHTKAGLGDSALTLDAWLRAGDRLTLLTF